jgi:hypothetical protein
LLPHASLALRGVGSRNTKLGAAKRAAGNIDYCLGSRRLRAVPTFLNVISAGELDPHSLRTGLVNL